MTAMKLSLIVSTFVYFVYSEPCIPADQCFPIKSGNSIAYFDKSFKMECNANGQVLKHIYNGVTDCSGANHATSIVDATQGTISGGDIQQDGVGSGGIITSYLQGTNCNIKAAASECTEYMVLKHRGNPNHQDNGVSKPFGDIGDNCTNYIGNEASFTHYSTVIAPVGCVNLASVTPGSHLYECDENGWSFKHYEQKGTKRPLVYTPHFIQRQCYIDCGGNILSAQSGAYKVDKCGYFSEWTHCNSVETGQTSGCVNDGVHVYFWYWYDLEYCPTSSKHSSTTTSPNGGSGSGTTSTTQSGSGGSGSGTTSTTQSNSGNGGGSGTTSTTSSNQSGGGTGTTSSTQSGNGSGSGTGTTSSTQSGNGNGSGSATTSSTVNGNNDDNTNNSNGNNDGTNDGSTVSENFGSDFWWWWIVVIALVVCCLCILCIGFFSYRRKRGNQYFGSGF